MSRCCLNYNIRGNIFFLQVVQVRLFLKSKPIIMQSKPKPIKSTLPIKVVAPKRSPAENADSGNDVFCCAFTTRQQCGSSSSPKTSRSSWAVFQSQSHGDKPAPAPPIKNQVIYLDHVSALLVSSDPASMLLTPPSARNRKAAKLPGICTWFWNLPVPLPS